ncbi:MAG: hypothetical protein PHG23_01095 [Candidatus Pacebacteria bacterium]|nr:hypothetical protein [Candidatus Paceibacterota bacterium]
MEKSEAIKFALSVLERAKTVPRADSIFSLDYLDYCMSENNLTAEDIGLKEEALRQMRIEAFELVIACWLNKIKENPINADFYLEYIDCATAECQSKTGHVIDLGSFVEDISKLEVARTQAIKIRAARWLVRAQTASDPKAARLYANFVRQDLNKGHLQPGAINTTEAKLQRLLSGRQTMAIKT